MNTYVRGIQVFVGGLLAAVGIWSCAATSNRDGSITISFAPDMTITAWGLEDALIQLIDLKEDCLSGTFGRVCTPEENADISEAIDSVLARKDRMRFGDLSGAAQW